MWLLTLLPFVLQAGIIGIDEWVFHLKRGLPRWERVGHPLDTLSVLLCMGWAIFVPFSQKALTFYALLAIFSTVFITKDEFVHQKHCPAAELWLHAFLFILHPITLTTAALLWPASQGIPLPSAIERWVAPQKIASLFLWGQWGAMLFFFGYQVLYWNYFRGKADEPI